MDGVLGESFGHCILHVLDVDRVDSVPLVRLRAVLTVEDMAEVERVLVALAIRRIIADGLHPVGGACSSKVRAQHLCPDLDLVKIPSLV